MHDFVRGDELKFHKSVILHTSQYLDLCKPSAYALANLDSLFSAVTAALNWDIGWRLEGKLFNMVTT